MDRTAEYRQPVKGLIQEYAQHKPAVGEVAVEAIADEAQDHYELMYAGWRGRHRIHGTVIHVDIRDGKVWIQYDGTEDGIAGELEAAGVPRDDIVLAFRTPERQKLTGYAVVG